MDVTEFPALEAGLVIVWMVMSKGHVMVTAGPPDFGASNGSLFFFDQE